MVIGKRLLPIPVYTYDAESTRRCFKSVCTQIVNDIPWRKDSFIRSVTLSYSSSLHIVSVSGRYLYRAQPFCTFYILQWWWWWWCWWLWWWRWRWWWCPLLCSRKFVWHAIAMLMTKALPTQRILISLAFSYAICVNVRFSYSFQYLSLSVPYYPIYHNFSI